MAMRRRAFIARFGSMVALPVAARGSNQAFDADRFLTIRFFIEWFAPSESKGGLR
jgi:hypothetical protein